jgi:hypothetical protein
MIYLILGRPRNYKKGKEIVVDECDSLEAARLEVYKLSGEMPSWMFWIDERDEDEKVQPYICAEPKPQI